MNFRRSRKNDVEVFTNKTRPCYERLYRLALFHCGDHDQASDLAQDTLIRAFDAFERFDLRKPIFPWLAKILRNLFLDSLKTCRARYEVTESKIGGDSFLKSAVIESCFDGPDLAAERSDLRKILLRAMARLDSTQRIVVVLCDVEGFGYAEVAEMMDVPLGTVQSRLARARQKLREVLVSEVENCRKNQ
ncbi:MAG: sigma-70 family RNA polymerase sigma factor [Pseudomonadota bacterium]